MKNFKSAGRSLLIKPIAAMIAGLVVAPSFAALTDLADAPLVDSSTTAVKPNILFTLDDSGSMAWSFLPDSAVNYRSAVGYRNHLCNAIYFNPSVRYLSPKKPDNTDFAAASFTSAKDNGFDTSSSTTNLSNNFQAYDNTNGNVGRGDPAPESGTAAYYFKFLGTGKPTDSQCNQTLSGYTASVWQKVVVPASEQANFANWYSFYRTRILMMKSSAGRAFANLSDRYRVGFITIHPNSTDGDGNITGINSNKFLAVGDFNQTQKDAWFKKFYDTTVDSRTPLREALSRAGRYYAFKRDGINQGITDDPVQYSCQQNFTILTTDGYWNQGDPVLLDGTSPIGNWDDDDVKPMWDGATAATQTTTVQRVKRYYVNRGACARRSGRQQLFSEIVDIATTTITPPGTVQPPIETVVSSRLEDATCIARSTVPATETISTNDLPPSKTTSGGTSDTLADVAEYYYRTDLRSTALGNCTSGATGADVCNNNVFGPNNSDPEDDNAKTQHMTTFTLGLGISGALKWDPDYQSQTSGDFADIRSGAKVWPTPSENSIETADDLWHAAVNGRGQAFSAQDPNDVVLGLQTALSTIASRTGAAAAAAASTLDPTSGDNLAYTPRYTTSQWYGDLLAREIDLSTGAVKTADLFSARDLLEDKLNSGCDTRKIYLYRESATNRLADFSWNTFSCATDGTPTGSASTGLDSTEQAWFGSTQVAALSQYSLMTDGSGSTVNQRSLAAGANLVNFLRGQNGKEGFTPNDANGLFRSRTYALGDIINGQPLYIRAPQADYTDTGYATFKAAQANRVPMVYVPANDGMLHAFNGGIIQTDASNNPLRDANNNLVLDSNAGKEAWAFVPRAVAPEMYRLADNNYANLHRFFVDGTAAGADVFIGGAWKTMLVGGLNKGGRGYYALDVTDPANPKGLWEFSHGAACYDSGSSTPQYSDCHLGYSYGNPIIGKLANGTWAVFLTSGYNNVNSPTKTGDGGGYLYVLRADDGRILHKIATGAGTSTDPSGLAKISAFVELPTKDSTIQRIYGGDLAGNLWRFDVNDTIAPSGRDAFKIATLKDSANNPQSISTRPVLSQIGNPPTPFVIVATGRYLGASDLSTTQTQSIYAFQELFPASTYSNMRSELQQMVFTESTDAGKLVRKSGCAGGTCSTAGKIGWYADFPTRGERSTITPALRSGTLVTATTIPSNDACTAGGSSWLNFVDYATGGIVQGGTVSGYYSPNNTVVGVNIFTVDGKPKVNTTRNDGTIQLENVTFSSSAASGHRVSWRELVD